MKRLTKMRVKNAAAAGAAFVLFVVVFSACGFGPNYNKPAVVSDSPEAKAVSGVERDIESMRTANFEFIFVFRRKDGGVFDSEDKAFLKSNAPAETNRFVLSDGEKSVVAGSSFKFEPKVLKKLEERFVIEDFSTPKEPAKSNSNQ